MCSNPHQGATAPGPRGRPGPVGGAAMVLVAGIGALGGPGRAAAQTPGPSQLLAGPATTPTAGAGRDLYLRDCAYCHGAEGEGTIYGPPVRGVGAASADFMLS